MNDVGAPETGDSWGNVIHSFAPLRFCEILLRANILAFSGYIDYVDLVTSPL